MRTKKKEGMYRGLVAPTSNNEELGQARCSRPRNDRGNGADRPPQVRKQRRGNRQGKGAGLVKIWCCPSTSALREEACANLNAMIRPGLWREQAQRSDKLDAGYRQLKRLRESYKSDRKRGVAGGKRRFLSLLREEMSEDQRERWMKRRALMRADRFTVGQRRELREWFDCLDKDGSGEIDSSELSRPLLCTGLARSALEVGRLVRQVDKDGSGEIGFHEFLAILQPKGATAGKSAIDKITHLQDVKKAHGSDMETVVAIERRSLLMKEILDEAAFRSSALDDVQEKRETAQSNGDHRALKELKEREAKLERRRVENNLFIQAVSDATDFEQERERLDNNILHKVRSRRELLQTSFAKGTSVVLPSQSKSNFPQTNAGKACTPLPGIPWTRCPEPRRADCGAGGSGAGGNGRVRFVESCKGGESVASNSAVVYNSGDRESRTLVAQEHHVRQRRLHHQNFKKSASARNLAGTDGMAGRQPFPARKRRWSLAGEVAAPQQAAKAAQTTGLLASDRTAIHLALDGRAVLVLTTTMSGTAGKGRARRIVAVKVKTLHRGEMEFIPSTRARRRYQRWD
ncbi:unnamed protein product [Ectocarpus sp. 12 AP-2014]